MVKEGWEVQVLTRHFTGEEGSAEDYRQPLKTPFSMSREEGVLVYRTPFINTWFAYYDYAFLRRTGWWKAIYLIQLLLGRSCQESYNFYFKKYLPLVLKFKKPDILLVESGPTNLVRLVARLAAKREIPFVVDFRDLYYHEMYQDFNGLDWNKKIKIRLEEWHMRQTIRRADRIISLNAHMLEVLKVPHSKRLIVSNGYDGDAWNNTKPVKDLNHFTISIVGTLYERPFLNIFLEAIQRFLQLNRPGVRIRFIAPGHPEVVGKIRKALPFPEVEIEEKPWPSEKALALMAGSEVLMYHGWAGYRQVMSTKIYDYIRSGSHVLIVPSDENGLDELIRDADCGVSCSKAAEGATQLAYWYEAWKQGELFCREIHEEKIKKYSRQGQNGILILGLKQVLKELPKRP